MLKALVPWLTAAGLLVSFTASAGYAPADPVPLVTARPFGVVEADRPAAPIDVAPWRGMFLAASLSDESDWSSDWMPHEVLQPRTPRTPVPLMFAARPMPSVLASFSGVPYAYEGYMPPVFLETLHVDGGTGSNAPNVAAGNGGASPSLLGAITARLPDGATPAVPRAVSLASTSPAAAEPEVVAMPRIMIVPGSSFAAAPTGPAQPDYASLIAPDLQGREQKCLAEAIYFEARSETPAGQAAVAQVVLNRVKSGLYPSSVCGVVYQNRHRYLACQFSFACEGKSLQITEPGPWQQAVRVAKDVVEGRTYLTGVGGATHYHANYVKPGWSRRLLKMDKIGTHIFYSLRPGQV